MSPRSKEADLRELDEIAETLEAVQRRARELIEQRRAIWARRTAKGDTTKVELAAASRTTAVNVAQGLRSHLVRKPLRTKVPRG